MFPTAALMVAMAVVGAMLSLKLMKARTLWASTDTEENITAIASLLQDLCVPCIELLPYNRAAGGKYAAVGRTYTPDFDESVPCEARLEIFARYGIRATLL